MRTMRSRSTAQGKLATKGSVLNESIGRSGRRVTLNDVSKAAGVSVMTASNVVTGKTNLVKPETRKRVESAVAQLGYRPNISARSLRLSQEYSVGIVIADSDPAFLTDPFISRLVSGLSNYLSRVEYTLDIQGIAPERFESATILKKVGNGALCAILCGPIALRRRQLRHLHGLGQPVVILQEAFVPRSSNVALIRQDDACGGAMLGKHLIEKDIRSVVFLRPALDWCAVEQREMGLRAVIRDAAPHVCVSTMRAPSEGFEDVQEAVKSYLATNRPDAIVAATDAMAVAALKANESLGLRVPADIMITGFNGFDVSRYTRPTLTTVLSPAYEMGQFAGEILVKKMGGDAFAKRIPVFPVALQVGGST
jgi:LacI family transcriptional regulator